MDNEKVERKSIKAEDEGEELRPIVEIADDNVTDGITDDVFTSEVDVSSRRAERNFLYTDPSLTPLIAAVRRGSSYIKRFLEKPEKKIDITEVDKFGRNAFHYSINKPKVLAKLLETFKTAPNIREALKQENKDGKTPMHEAAYIGNRESLEILFNFDNSLIKLRSKISKRTILHCAVKGAALYTVQYIDKHDPIQLNMVDNMAQTVLHYAAATRERDILEYLLSKGADSTTDDGNGQLPIHIAARCGFLKGVEIFSQNEPGCIDFIDNSGKTPLMIAAEQGFENVVTCLLNKAADYKAKCNVGFTPFDFAVTNNRSSVVDLFLQKKDWKQIIEDSYIGPENCLMKFIQESPETAVKLMDKCIKTKGNIKDDPQNYKVIYDFFCLDWRDVNESIPRFDALTCMVDNKSVECLSHPLCVKFINKEWRFVGFKYYAAVILVSIIFHTCLMTFTAMMRGTVRTRKELAGNMSNVLPKNRNIDRPDYDAVIALRIIMLIIVFGTMIKEVIQIWVQRSRYFLQSTHYMQWSLLVTVLFYLFPIRDYLTSNQLRSGSVCVMISWTILIRWLQMVPMFGVYILAVIKVFRTFLKIMIVIALFLFSFSTTFYILLGEFESFNEFGISFVSSFNGMINGLDYEDIFVNKTGSGNLYEMRLVVLVFFIIIMSIVVNNTLIGLAVGDTDSVMKSARLEKFRTKVRFIIYLEQTVGRIICSRAPRKKRIIDYPKRKKSGYNRFLDFVYSGTTLTYMGHESWRARSKMLADEEENQQITQEARIEDHFDDVLSSKMELMRSVIHQEVSHVLEKINRLDEEMVERKKIEKKILEKLLD